MTEIFLERCLPTWITQNNTWERKNKAEQERQEKVKRKDKMKWDTEDKENAKRRRKNERGGGEKRVEHGKEKSRREKKKITLKHSRGSEAQRLVLFLRKKAINISQRQSGP